MCANGNVTTSKVGATVVLRSLLSYHIDVDALPMGDMSDDVFERIVVVVDDVRSAKSGVQEKALPARILNRSLSAEVKSEPHI